MPSFFSWSTKLDLGERLLPWGCLLALALLAFIPASTPIVTIVIVLNLITASWAIGARLAPRTPRLAHVLIGVVTLIAAQSLLQTAWYYAGGLLGTQSDVLSLFVPLLVFQLWELRSPPLETPTLRLPTRAAFLEQARWVAPILLGAELLLGSIILFAKSVASEQALNSPWPLLPAGILAAFFLLFVIGWIASVRTHSPLVTAIVTSSLFWGVACITPIVYLLGFGFDGFLHRASEQILLTTGTLTPKPPYYLGQYVFVTWLSRLSTIAFSSIDRWLVPLSAGLLSFAALALPSQPEDRRYSLLTLAALFPLGVLITTTPQSFAYLLGLAAIFLASGLADRRIHPVLPFLLASWSVITHPLAGLPLALIVAGQFWLQFGRRHALPAFLTGIGAFFCALMVSASVPLAFAFHGQTSAHQVDWHVERLANIHTWQTILQDIFSVPITHLALWPDWADTVTWLIPFFLVGGAIFTLWKRRDERATSLFFCVSSFGLFVAGIVLSQTGEFAFLIDYERGNYAERLFLLAQLVLLPIALGGWALIWKRIQVASPLIVSAWVVFFGALVCGHVYNALPRHDAGIIGHGWSVGLADREAVKFIDKDAQGENYTVLANQSVSAIAVATLGFKRYYGDVFFYPIPTGGPLYQLFLEATDIPSRDPIEAAAALGNSKRVYLVLNKYWWNATNVQEALRGIADKTWSVRNGEDYIFRFDVSTSTKP